MRTTSEYLDRATRQQRRRWWWRIGRLLADSVVKLDPRTQVRNPVLFIVWCGAVLATIVAIVEPLSGGAAPTGGMTLPATFTWAVAVWLWLTLLSANFAEALAEGRGRAGVVSIRIRHDAIMAHRVRRYDATGDAAAENAVVDEVPSRELRPGDVVVLSAGDAIPADGTVVWGIASIDESAITGESAPVIRESGKNRFAVTGGTRVLSDRIVVRLTTLKGNTVVDQMIGLAQGARRQKAPNELALSTLLASFSITFLLVALTVNAIVSPVASTLSIPVLVALVACLVPTEIAALLSVTGIAGMYRLLQQEVIVESGRALENVGEITTVLLDKTGTITEGDRRATELVPIGATTTDELARMTILASLDDPTTEGISTLTLARESRPDGADRPDSKGRVLTFSAETRMSGRDLADGVQVRKGAESAILSWLKHVGSQQTRAAIDELREVTGTIARTGGTPLVVALKTPSGPGRLLGVVHLKDVIKPPVRARIDRLKSLGVRAVMVTGDNPMTAAAIAREAGVDDYIGDATPEKKLEIIKQEQADGHFVAMAGDGTNDVPALAQADVGVAMNNATNEAKDAANMVVLDDDPTRLVEIIEIGSRQRATRGALTTFNIANDLVRYVAIFPALFVGMFPGLAGLNILGLHSAASAILSTVIFSVLVIAILIPLALVGMPYRMTNLGRALNWNLLFYGLGGILVPVIGIKLIDLVVALFPGY